MTYKIEIKHKCANKFKLNVPDSWNFNKKVIL